MTLPTLRYWPRPSSPEPLLPTVPALPSEICSWLGDPSVWRFSGCCVTQCVGEIARAETERSGRRSREVCAFAFRRPGRVTAVEVTGDWGMAIPGLLAPEIHCPDGRLRGSVGCIRGGLMAEALLAASQPSGAPAWRWWGLGRRQGLALAALFSLGQRCWITQRLGRTAAALSDKGLLERGCCRVVRWLWETRGLLPSSQLSLESWMKFLGGRGAWAQQCLLWRTGCVILYPFYS